MGGHSDSGVFVIVDHSRKLARSIYDDGDDNLMNLMLVDG